ncbi:MAG: DUF2802 domain-containing protein [Sulfuriflexus sp.]|nr:DUF2802 domain-containing protein [Sulfuriflexus sp.]
MDIYYFTMLLLAGAMLLGVVLTISQSIKIQRDKKRIASLELIVDDLHNNFNALCSGSVGVGKRISRLESKSRLQADRQLRLEDKTPAMQNYGNAAKLANKGADMDELVDYCGLSRGEAELILFLNSQQQDQQTH